MPTALYASGGRRKFVLGMFISRPLGRTRDVRLWRRGAGAQSSNLARGRSRRDPVCCVLSASLGRRTSAWPSASSASG